MDLQYKGSTFGRQFPAANKDSSTKKRRAHLTVNPLNPWFLSNGIPDFSPQIDRNYEMLTMKRKVSLLEDKTKNIDGEKEEFVGDNDKQVTKKLRMNKESEINIMHSNTNVNTAGRLLSNKDQEVSVSVSSNKIHNRACFGAGCYWGTEKYFKINFAQQIYPESMIKNTFVGKFKSFIYLITFTYFCLLPLLLKAFR